jgi:4'-phosphopantetheinyl transferase
MWLTLIRGLMQPIRYVDFGKLFKAATVDVWTVPIRTADFIEVEFAQFLASDEIECAAKFRHGHLRSSYTQCRAALRVILGRYLGVHPLSFRFSYESAGKPYLNNSKGVEFNVSHSHDLVFLAFSNKCAIGIDVEFVRPLSDLDQVAKSVLTVEEFVAFSSLPANDRERAFYRCWTQKEAYLKATGRGLSGLPVNLGLPVQSFHEAQPIKISDCQTSNEYWTLHDIDFSDEYAASLIYYDSPRTVRRVAVSNSTDILKLL